MFTRNDNEDEKVELTLPLAEEICSRHMWCVLNNDDIEDNRKGPLNHHAMSCHVMAMIYHQALLMWPTGIASEEDIHGAAQLLMKSIAKIRAAFTFRKKFRSRDNESTNAYSHHSKDLVLIGDNILHTGTQHTSSC